MEVYLVGGAVRDQLLSYPVQERDWVVVGGTPEELLEQGFRQVGRDFPVFLHPESGEEYALARTERKQGHGYQGFECNSDPSVTLEEDLYRRDLTVNAMALDDRGRLIDPYGGQADLAQRVLRHVSPAFVEDPLRVLRVARFAARYAHLGFEIAPETLSLMGEIADSGELAWLASERVWTELDRALCEQSPTRFFTALRDCGALLKLLPELELEAPLLQALERACATSADTAVRLAALLANAGTDAVEDCNARLKPPVRQRDLNRLCTQWLEGFRGAEKAPAGDILALLTGVDAFRRPERFEDFLQACAAAADLPAPAEHLRRALALCNTIEAGDLARQGVKGAEIGRRVEAERLKALESR